MFTLFYNGVVIVVSERVSFYVKIFFTLYVVISVGFASFLFLANNFVQSVTDRSLKG